MTIAELMRKERIGYLEAKRRLETGEQMAVRSPDLLSTLTNPDRRLLKAFVEEVERRAENNMLKTGKLEGAHYAAMKALLKELCG